MDYLESPIHLTCMFLGGGKEPEYLQTMREHANRHLTSGHSANHYTTAAAQDKMVYNGITAELLYSFITIIRAVQRNYRRCDLLKTESFFIVTVGVIMTFV